MIRQDKRLGCPILLRNSFLLGITQGLWCRSEDNSSQMGKLGNLPAFQEAGIILLGIAAVSLLLQDTCIPFHKVSTRLGILRNSSQQDKQM